MSTTLLNQENIIKKVYDPSTESLVVSGTVTTTAPVGGATEAEQQTQTAVLEDIKTDTTELNLKTSASLVHEPHDYKEITYVGATTNINTVVHKLGGPSGTVVATLTMGYDGSNRLTSVTKT